MVCRELLKRSRRHNGSKFYGISGSDFARGGFQSSDAGGRRLGAISGAGFEAVGMADSIQSDDYNMSFGRCSDATLGRHAQAH